MILRGENLILEIRVWTISSQLVMTVRRYKLHHYVHTTVQHEARIQRLGS